MTVPNRSVRLRQVFRLCEAKRQVARMEHFVAAAAVDVAEATKAERVAVRDEALQTWAFVLTSPHSAFQMITQASAAAIVHDGQARGAERAYEGELRRLAEASQILSEAQARKEIARTLHTGALNEAARRVEDRSAADGEDRLLQGRPTW